LDIYSVPGTQGVVPEEQKYGLPKAKFRRR
jgi:hypothetical protein